MPYKIVPQFSWDVHLDNQSTRIGVIKLEKTNAYGRTSEYVFFPNSKVDTNIVDLVNVLESIATSRDEIAVSITRIAESGNFVMKTSPESRIRNPPNMDSDGSDD